MLQTQFLPSNKPLAAPQTSRSTGFTLLELLVAMAVFALISVSVYATLGQMLLSRSVLESRYSALAELQRVFVYIERDLLQAVERKVKNPYGDAEPAFKLVDGQNLSLTRTGAGPLSKEDARSSLLRLRYRLEDKAVWRSLFPVLDLAQDSLAAQRQLLSRVESLQFSVFNDGAWLQEWPPMNVDSEDIPLLPQAVRVLIKLAEGRALQHTVRLSRAADVGRS
jgi:general secretion pathway protein J